MYSYIAKIERVVDGDTLDVKVDLGFYLTQIMRLRLKGINTPEKSGKEKMRGLEAKKFVEKELAQAVVVGIRTYKQEKFGRYVTDLYYSKRKINPENIFNSKYSLNELLVKKKLAVRAFENLV